MSSANVRRTHPIMTFALFALTLLVVALMSAATASAQPDTFLNGDGHDGAATFGNATFVPNAVAPVSGAVAVGASSLTIGTIRAGSGTNNVTFANNRLVMVYQSNGTTGTPTSGDTTAVALSSSTAGHWEFARISTVAGSTLNFTNPLIYAYASGKTQVIAVPEYTTVTVNNSASLINAPAWDGSSGGVVAMLANNTINFSAAGTVSANGLGFRGGISYNENSGGATGCSATQYDSPGVNGTYAMKGEGFYSPGFLNTTPATATTQQGRGNYQNAGGGGNCFNAGGGGGANKGAGGVGGNSLINYTNGNQAVGGIGGAALTYNAYAQAPMGGGGGAGERNNADPGSGGAGGGVVMVRGSTLTGTGKFTANGSNGVAGNTVSTPYDGAGGGGAGGTVIVRMANGATCGSVTATGGAGGNNSSFSGYNWTPGGGGGGGAAYVQGSSVSCSATVTAGAAGTNGGNVYGAAAGGAGASTSNASGIATPTAAITTPANGSSTNDTTPTISGTATANSTVYIVVDGSVVTSVTADGSGNWTYTSGVLTTGSHTVKVRAEVAGLSSDYTSTNTFTIDTTAPSAPTITTPASSPYYTSDTTPTIAGTAEANSTVKVYDGVTLVGTTTANGSGNWTLDTSALSAGSHTITATATDAASNVSGASGSKTVVVDTTAPTVNLTAPANGAYVNTTTPTITFSVTDTNPSASSSCVIDGGAPVSCTSGYVTGALTQGSHTVVVSHTDLAGNVGTSATNTFTVDSIAPAAPAITTPASSPFNTNDTTPTVAGTAEANSTVKVYDGVTLVGTTTANGSGNWTLDTSALSTGSHTITATATDAAGNVSGASGSKTIVIDTSAPAAPAITTPATSPFNTNDTTPTVAGTAEANSTVKVYDGVTLVGTTTADGSGNWTLDTSALSTGSHTITATATDLAGNTSAASSSKTIVIDTSAPAAPAITTPATSPYTTNDSTPTIAGTAEANSTVKVYDGVTLVGTTTANGSGNWTLDTSTLIDGSHTITATATDAANNTSVASTSKTVIVDTAAPSAPAITTPASSPYYTSDTTPTVAGTAEANSTVKVYDGVTLVGTTTADGSGNWTLDTSALSTGSHSITATATDAAGNTSSASSGKTIVVDTTAPIVVISGPVNGSTINTSTPTVTFSITDNNPAASSQCQIDGGSFTSCSSGFATASLGEGAHTITVQHTDLAGNVGSSSTSFTVDTVAPAAPNITSGPNGPVASTSAAFTFTGEPGATYECYIDSPVSWTSCTSPASYNSLAQGPHTFHVRQTDTAGNVSNEATQSWSVDTVGPPAPSVSGPSGTVGATSATISFSDTENPVTFMCSLDGAPAAACTSPVGLSGLANGPHSYSVYAVDPLGNAGSATTINWTVDTSLFSVAINSGPTGTVATSDNAFTFVATITSGTTYECKIDAGSYASCSSPFSTGSLSDGAHTFYVRALNGVQTSPVAQQSWTIDTTAPSITISSPTNGQTVGSSGGVSFSTSDSTGPVTTACAVDGGSSTSCTSPYAFSGLSDGPHSVTVTATDAVGNSGSLVRNFVVDATPPNTTIDSNPPAETNSTSATFTFSSSEPSSTFECQLDGGGWGSCSSPISGSGLLAGSHTFEVRATDQYGNTDATPASYTWTIDLTAPAAPDITDPSGDIVTNDTTPPVSGTAEPNSVVKVYDGVTLIGTANVDGGGNWFLGPDPSLPEGVHQLTATATDVAGNVSGASVMRQITVDTTNPTLTIDSPTEGQLINDNTPDITFDAQDANGTTSECRVDNGPWTSCSSPWTTPVLADGDHTVDVRTTDGGGNTASDQRNFTVDATAPADPVISTPAVDGKVSDLRPTIGGTAEALSTIKVYDNGNLIGTTTADGSGDWTFTPGSDLSQGPHPFVVTATDAAGNVSGDSNTRNLWVDTIAPANPVITVPASDITSGNPRPTLSGTSEPYAQIDVYEGASLIGTVYADVNGDWTVTAQSDLADGPHAFHVTATDDAGNTSGDSNVRTITIDTTAPAAPAITTPATDITTATATQAIAGTAEPGSTVEIFDGATSLGTATADVNGDWSLSPDPTFSEGPHQITAKATDDSGNTSPASQVRTITIDTTAPAAPSIDSPSDGAFLGDSTPDISGTAEPGATVKVYDTDNTLLCTATADVNGDWACTSIALAEGDHGFTALATDPSGNTGDPSATVDVTVDLTAPSVAISDPLSGSTVTTHTPDVSFSATDATALTVECKVDSGSYTACTSPWTTPSLADGSHTVTVRATDAGGNSATATVSFTVDTTAPVSQITQKPAAQDNDSTPDFGFTSNDPGATFECSIDGAPFTSCSSPFTAGPLSDGPHTFSVRATDSHGNVESPGQSYSWIVDTTPPAAPVVTSPTDGSTTSDSTPAISGTAEPSSTVTVTIDGNVVGTATTDDTGHWTLNSTHLSDGSHTISAVTATDEAGNVGTPSAPVTFTVDTTAPTGTVVEQTGTGDDGTNPTFDITPNEGDTTITCSLDGAPAAPCSSPYTPTGTLSVGTHTLVVTFTDAVGNSHQEILTFVIKGKTVPGGGGDPLPSGCFAKGIAITNLSPKGNKVTINGFARLSYVGQTVSIGYKPTGSKVVATTVVGTDGAFSVTLKAPKKSLWLSNKTLYRASVSGESTPWTKLARRMASSTATYSGGKLTVNGSLTKPLLPKLPIKVVARTGCDQPWAAVGTTKVKSNGTFSLTVPYTQSTGVIFVRVDAVVGNGVKAPKKPLKTHSFVIPVVVR